MRNQLIHAYLGVDLDVVWDVVQAELPLLIQQLKAVKSGRTASNIGYAQPPTT